MGLRLISGYSHNTRTYCRKQRLENRCLRKHPRWWICGLRGRSSGIGGNRSRFPHRNCSLGQIMPVCRQASLCNQGAQNHFLFFAVSFSFPVLCPLMSDICAGTLWFPVAIPSRFRWDRQPYEDHLYAAERCATFLHPALPQDRNEFSGRCWRIDTPTIITSINKHGSAGNMFT